MHTNTEKTMRIGINSVGILIASTNLHSQHGAFLLHCPISSLIQGTLYSHHSALQHSPAATKQGPSTLTCVYLLLLTQTLPWLYCCWKEGPLDCQVSAQLPCFCLALGVPGRVCSSPGALVAGLPSAPSSRGAGSHCTSRPAPSPLVSHLSQSSNNSYTPWPLSLPVLNPILSVPLFLE